MSDSNIEKRRHTRIAVDLDYKLVIDDIEFEGKIGNISLSGTYLATSTPPLPQSCVIKKGQLKIKTPDQWVSLLCEIVYVGNCNDERFPDGTGVVFCEHNEDTATVIWNLAIHYLNTDNQLF